jgi:hypothetical protein
MNQSFSSPKFAAHPSAALMKTRSTIPRITAALVLCGCVVAATAQSDNPAFAKFKSEMMPKVGQRITVVGTWSDGTKQCCWLAFNNWGAYIIFAAKESRHANENDLFAHFRDGQNVKVTGTLRHFAPPKQDEHHVRAVQIPPEHFFFYAAEVEMAPVPPSVENPRDQRQ